MTPKPQAKANLIHQQILGSLLANKTVSRKETRPKKDGKDYCFDPQTRERYQVQLYRDEPIEIPVAGLAGHVSDHNLNRMARRWAA